MAESFVQLNNDGPGKKIDTFTEATAGQHRQAMVVADPSVTGGTATVDPTLGLSVNPKALAPNAAKETGGNLDSIKADLDTIKTNTTQLATTQPVSLPGSVTVIQPIGTNLHAVIDSGTVTINPLTTASTIDVQLGDGVGNAITSQANGAQRALDVGIDVAGIQVDPRAIRALTSADTVTVVQPTGTNLHVVVDTAPTTMVVQPTGTNLHTVVDSGTIIANAGTGTFAVSAAALPLPSGAATSANQATEIASLSTLVTNTPSVGQKTMANSSPVVIASDQSAVPTTLASTTITNTVNVIGTIVDGSTAEVPLLVIGGETADATAQYQPLPLTAGGVSVKVDGSAVTQPISGTVNQGTANVTPWTQNITQVGGSATATAAAGTLKVGVTGSSAAVLDTVITAATAPANGLAILTVAQTTAPSLTAGQSVAVQCDYVGSAFVKPYRRSQVVSKATTIAASTAATTVLAAQGAGIFADISNLIVTTTPAATTSTAYTVTLSDGTNSYIFDLTQGLATAAGEDQVNINFNPPLPAATANTAWTITNSTTTPTNHITIVAVLQKAS